MSEIKQKPVKIVVDGVEYDAFSEIHSFADIARWVHEAGGSEDTIFLLKELSESKK